MLFSHEETAAFLGDRFEPAWTSLRPVPTLTLDFGDGRRTVRTLHGNVVTFVCAADGTVIDALPGIYDAAAYRAALEGILRFAGDLAPLDSAARAEALAAYHRRNGVPGRTLTMPSVPSSSKLLLERPSEAALTRAFSGGPTTKVQLLPTATRLRALVREDARAAETVGRAGVHAILADAGTVLPKNVVGRILREVLRCDLDDPMLGLGPALSGADPVESLRADPIEKLEGK